MSCQPSAEFLALIPREFARRHLIVSEGARDGHELLRVSRDSDSAAIHNVGARLGRPVRHRLDEPTQIARDVDAAFGRTHAHVEGVEASGSDGSDQAASLDIEHRLALADRDLLSTTGKGEVVRLVDHLLFRALSLRASDVHVQPVEDRTLIRYRVDGAMFTDHTIARALTPAVVGRIKVMARMDIAERRVPQDGRATVTLGVPRPPSLTAHAPGICDTADPITRARVVDLRISTLPTSFGERAVIRLLDNSAPDRPTDFESLGMPGSVRRQYLDRASRASGVVLLTGPTGSGKTTTLYATLRWLAGERSQRGQAGPSSCPLNIMTIEDPIEYQLTGVGISQAQMNSRKGITFSSGLRHILRQDPDVIMVGEIRDSDTARIAVQASLTGHLVFSTLHTNDASSAVTRLLDLGVEPFLLGTSLSAVMAQRLVRRIHEPCRGCGCDACLGTGFLGRVALFELLAVNDAVREMVTARAPAADIRAAARRGGMESLSHAGRELVNAGLTTDIEVRRATLGADAEFDEPSSGAEPFAN